MDLEEINDTYGKFIWSIAGRYHMGVWDQTDVYNEILLFLFLAIEQGKIPIVEPNETRRLVHSFVICRAIDIIRKEYKRKGIGSIYRNREMVNMVKESRVNRGDDEHMFDEDMDLDTEASKSEAEYEMEKRFIWELLVKHLPPKSALFVYELAFPSPETIEIAMEEQREAQQDEGLRMNVNVLRILPKHVAASLGPDIPFSKATMSRIKKQAREMYIEIMELEIKTKKSYVTAG